MPELKQEQLDIINHQSGDILISASAGSGKTFVMIRRLIRLITEGHAKVDEILAVTFTEAAATEMKERLKSALLEKIAGGREDLSDQLHDVSNADISTLHSFCARLIRTYFYVADVSPDFKILDATESKILKDKAVSKLMRSRYVENSDEFNEFLNKFIKKRSDANLKNIIQTIYEYASVEANPDSVYQLHKQFYTIDGYQKLCDDYKGILDEQLVKLKQSAYRLHQGFKNFRLIKSADFCVSLIQDIEKALNVDIYGLKEFENYSLRLSFENKLTGEPLELKTKATAIRDLLKKQFKTYCKGVTNKTEDLKRLPEILSTTDYLIGLVKEYGEIYSALKTEENVLDFNDLEHFAYKTLSDENVKNAVREKYKFVFVDEYQDTNGVQEAIITAVSNDNLFMVGDVKQSIYGFRGCNPDIFSNKMKSMQESGKKTAMLNYNFRSADNVIDKVNEIFTYCMKKDNFGEDYSLNSTLKPGGIYGEENKGRATVHLLVKPEKKPVVKETPRVYDILQEIKNPNTKKAKTVSSLITEIIREELGKTYYNPKEGKEKIVTFNDIVILTRNRSNEYVETLVDGLKRHGINVVSEVSQDVCAYPEIQVLINALRLIDCYKTDIPLATVMKSSIGGFTEEDLAEIVLFYTENKGKNGFYDAYNYYLNNAKGDLYEKVKVFDEYVKELRYLSDFIGAKGVLQKIMDDSMYLTFILAEKHGELKLKRIRKFMELTESQGVIKTVSEVLDNIDNAKDAYKTSFNSDEEAVRVMTIHASKGLEFPVVIVCGLERKMNVSEEREEVLLSRDCGLAPKYYDQENKTYSETLLRSFIRQKMKTERVKEEMRLFYVATTRASYSLHLTFEGESVRGEEFTSADKMLDYLPPNLQVVSHSPEDFEFTDLTKEQKQVIIGKPDLSISGVFDKNFEFTYPYLSDTVLPLKTNVTDIVKSENYKKSFSKVALHGETDETKGTLAHKILELYDFNSNESLETQINGFIKSGLINQETLSDLSLDGIKKVLDSEVLNSLKDCELFKEKSFIINVPASFVTDTPSTEKVLVQGVIDLLAVKDNKAQIIDYKYSVHGEKVLRERYSKQLELYAYAVEKALGIKVTKKVIVNIFTGDVIELN